MSEAELLQELADRANALGVKIDVNIGEQHPHAPASFKTTVTRLNSTA